MARTQTFELMNVVLGKLVVQRGIDGVFLQGEPTLLIEPDDAADAYLAENSVSLDSVPPAVHRKLSHGATFFFPGGEKCFAELGTVSAYAWAAAPVGEHCTTWESKEKADVAKLVFAHGTRFLGANVPSACVQAPWATLGKPNLHFQKAALAPAGIASRCTAWLKASTTQARLQKRYEHFRESQRPLFPGGIDLDAKLPSAWLDLGGEDMFWLLQYADGLTFVVGHRKRQTVASQLPDPTSLPRGFSTSLVMVWQLQGNQLSPVAEPGSLSDYEFNLHGGLAAPGRWPILLYSTETSFGALRPERGAYALSTETRFGPKQTCTE